jgi:hypothetical protein
VAAPAGAAAVVLVGAATGVFGVVSPPQAVIKNRLKTVIRTAVLAKRCEDMLSSFMVGPADPFPKRVPVSLFVATRAGGEQ